MKFLTILLISIFSVNNPAIASNDSQTAKGAGDYIRSHSKVENIIRQRDAETAALAGALSVVTKECQSENFKLNAVNYKIEVQDPMLPFVDVVATVAFECTE